MAAKAIQMEQLQQVLQLKRDGLSIKAIACYTGIARNTIKKYLARIDCTAGAVIKDQELSQAAFNNDSTELKGKRYAVLLAHFSYAETELNKTGVTRQLLWLEYKEQYADGYNYSQYCYHLNEFLRHKEVVMHLELQAAAMCRLNSSVNKLETNKHCVSKLAHFIEIILLQKFIEIVLFTKNNNCMPKKNHEKAAMHHEEAAKHHKSAAEESGKGNHEKAASHAQSAHGHSSKANEHAHKASAKHAHKSGSMKQEDVD